MAMEDSILHNDPYLTKGGDKKDLLFEKVLLAKSISIQRYHNEMLNVISDNSHIAECSDSVGDTDEIHEEKKIENTKANIQEEIENILVKDYGEIEYLSDNYYLEIKKFGKNALTEKEMNRIIMNYREDFGYGWGEYKKCPVSGCQCIMSIRDYFELGDKEYISLEELENTHPNKGKVVNCNKGHPEQTLIDFWDFTANKEELTEKFQKKDGTIALLKDVNNDVVGYAWAYIGNFATFNKFELEKFDEYSGRIDDFKKGLAEALDRETIEDEDLFYIWNSIGIQQGHRKKEHTLALMKALMSRIPDEYKQLPGILEANQNTVFYYHIEAGGAKIAIHGKDEEYVLMLSAKKAEDFAKYWLCSEEEYIHKHELAVKKYKEYRENKSHRS